MLSHRNIVTQMRHAPEVLAYTAHEERLAFLPMCHVAERIAGCYYGPLASANEKSCTQRSVAHWTATRRSLYRSIPVVAVPTGTQGRYH
jgi:long-subunit acyl-CoA synthetase (AMP-forming)